MIGRTISHYEIIEKLGEGRTGTEPARGFPQFGKWWR